ncbi:MAG: hypothetical protein ACOWWO_04690 [Peptococcaceae bacterium]
MFINIAAFGSEKLMPGVLAAALQFPELKITPFTYKVPEECPLLVRAAENYDVLFFTGILPYVLSKEETRKKNLPAVHIKFDDLNVALTLLNFYHQFNKKFNEINFSIDIPGAENVRRVLKELSFNQTNIFINDLYYLLHEKNEAFITDNFVHYHYELWQEGKIDLAITSIAAVERQLKALGVNCLGMPMPEKNILNALVEASSIGKLNFNKGMQIAIGFICLHNLQDNIGIFHELHGKLVNFANEIDASLQYLGNDLYILYMTRNGLEYITNFYQDLYIIPEINHLFNINLSFGLGLGLTTKEAERNAQTALTLARESGGNCAFVISSENKVIGPLNKGVRNYLFKTDNIKHLEVAKKTGIGIINLSKIFEFLKLRKYEPFTSLDLANYLQVSQRSSERFIKKLVDKHYCQIIGTEANYQKGRPRALYLITRDHT